MDLESVRREIDHMRVQAGRQRKEILQLQRAGIPTASAELLLLRMQDRPALHQARGTEEGFVG